MARSRAERTVAGSAPTPSTSHWWQPSQAVERPSFAAGRHLGLRQHLANDGVTAASRQRAAWKYCGGGSTPPRRTNARKLLDD